jgi:hypothetical protein
MATVRLPTPLNGLDQLPDARGETLNIQPGMPPGVCYDVASPSSGSETHSVAPTGNHQNFPAHRRMIAWGQKVSVAFKIKLLEICDRLALNPDYLMAVIAFQTAGTFSPSVKNKLSGATGLIQFLASTAKGLNTNLMALASMDAVQQLDYIEKYFLPYAGKLYTLEDVYMAVLYPPAIGKPNEYVLFTQGTKAYEQNAALDRPMGKLGPDGKITKAEAAAKVRQQLELGLLHKG